MRSISLLTANSQRLPPTLRYGGQGKAKCNPQKTSLQNKISFKGFVHFLKGFGVFLKRKSDKKVE